MQQWWQGREGRNRLILLGFGLIVLAFMIFNATGILTAGDTRQVVVSLKKPATDEQRAEVKQRCGSLPGIAVVEDRGDPAKQNNLPVRFSLRGSTAKQEIDLSVCIQDLGPLVASIDTDG